MVQAVPSSNDIVAYIKRSQRNLKKTVGVKFFPTLEVRVIADRVLDLKNPSFLHLLQSLVDISQKRSIDERMLSNTSMAAKYSQVFQIIADEIIGAYNECVNFHHLYKGIPVKPPDSFITDYPGYQSETDEEGKHMIHM